MDEFAVPFRYSLQGVSREEFLCPGSIVRVLVDNTQPTGNILQSGWLHGESYLHNKVGVADVKWGRAVLLINLPDWSWVP